MSPVVGRATGDPPSGPPDRSGWISVFGWIQIVLAALALLSVPLAFANPHLGRDAPEAAAPALGPGIVSAGINVLTAAFFAWTGIATLRVSRWVRPLVLSAAKLWLLTGLVALLAWLFAAPALGSLLAATGGVELPPALVTALIVFLTGVLAFFYVILPLVFLRFFSAESVRLTFERHDPRPAATETSPAPVLALTLTLALLAATALIFAPLAVIGLFGVVLTGAPAVLAWILIGAGLGYLTLEYWRLRPAGWWGTLGATLLATAGAAVTVERSDAASLLAAAGFPQEQIDALAWMGLTRRPVLHAAVALSAALVLVSLFRTYRFFRSRSPL